MTPGRDGGNDLFVVVAAYWHDYPGVRSVEWFLRDWDAAAAQVCWPEDGPPCVDCLMVIRVDVFAPDTAVWAYRDTADDTLRALLNLVHPHHPDAPDVPFPAPRSLRIVRHEQRPMTIRAGSAGTSRDQSRPARRCPTSAG